MNSLNSFSEGGKMKSKYMLVNSRERWILTVALFPGLCVLFFSRQGETLGARLY